MVKKCITLNIDDDIIEEAKRRNYNISFLCSEALRVYIDENYSDIEVAARLSAMDTIIRDAEVDVKRKSLEYSASIEKYKALVARRDEINNEFLEAQRTLKVSRMIRELNSNIIACDFNVQDVKWACGDLISNIKEISGHFDVDAHVARLKNVLL